MTFGSYAGKGRRSKLERLSTALRSLADWRVASPRGWNTTGIYHGQGKRQPRLLLFPPLERAMVRHIRVHDDRKDTICCRSAVWMWVVIIT
jgi:hypothetical protein